MLVADFDADDDGTNIDTGLFNTFALTPAVDLAGIVPGSVRIALDSFRSLATPSSSGARWIS